MADRSAFALPVCASLNDCNQEIAKLDGKLDLVREKKGAFEDQIANLRHQLRDISDEKQKSAKAKSALIAQELALFESGQALDTVKQKELEVQRQAIEKKLHDLDNSAPPIEGALQVLLPIPATFDPEIKALQAQEVPFKLQVAFFQRFPNPVPSSLEWSGAFTSKNGLVWSKVLTKRYSNCITQKDSSGNPIQYPNSTRALCEEDARGDNLGVLRIPYEMGKITDSDAVKACSAIGGQVPKWSDIFAGLEPIQSRIPQSILSQLVPADKVIEFWTSDEFSGDAANIVRTDHFNNLPGADYTGELHEVICVGRH